MAKQGMKAVTPSLRFPEFLEESWGRIPGDKLFESIRNRNAEGGLPILAITQEHGAIPRELIDYHVSVTEQSIQSYKVVERGDFIISLRSFQGGIEYSNYRGICSPAYVILRRKGEGSSQYFKHLFKSGRFIQQMTRNIEGLRDGKMISYKQFSELLIPTPTLGEQKKIADCLTSLDEMIAAQGRKVEALKAHKRGLMQQLFPREGETRPRLRFPEFRNAPEWKVKPLGDCVDLLSGYPFNGEDIVEDRSGERLMRGINVTEGVIRHGSDIDRYYLGSLEGLEKFRLKVNDLVIGMDGSKVGKNSALIEDADAGALLIQRVARLRAPSALLIHFIFHQVHSPRFHSYVDRINTSSGIPHISAKQIKEYPAWSPSDREQQRIVDCLSSLDTRIRAEGDRLAALKNHRQGLMQQLFPAPEAMGT